ncbi:MAG: TSUP family transporter, partial [Gammaproteobacteria bacterium]|nr:TSUP family transporter [Gammaproteobacteria bacterium]
HGVKAQNAVATSAACGYPIAVAGTFAFVILGLGGDLPRGAIGYVHLPAFLGIAVTSALAAPVGVAAVHRLPPKLVKKLFGSFLLLVGVRMLAGF